MKQKIIEALKQTYAATNPSKDSGRYNLGLDETAFERVAGLGETFITDESQIENFVKGAESLLKGFQSEGDKLRNAQKRIAELEKPNDDGKPNPTPALADKQPQDFAKMIADAVAAAVKPLSDELAGFKQKQTVDAAIVDAKAKFVANDYVKKYKTEADDAWERVMELHAYNKDWTSDEMAEKAMGYFNKTVSRMNIDTSKPFEGAGNPQPKADFSEQAELLRMQGVDIREPKND